MTTAREVDVPTAPGEILIAGVPWPIYKVVALVVGVVSFVIIGAATMAAAPAVLGGAGAATAVWLGMSLFHPER